MLNVSLLWCANSILLSLISVISQLFQPRCKKNSTPASYFIRLHGTGRRNFCSLHDSHNRKLIIPIHQQGEGNTVVQNKASMAGNFHILIPGHFISPDKDWFLSKFNPGWETLKAQMEPQMQKWGTLTKVHPGRGRGFQAVPFLQQQTHSGRLGAWFSFSHNVVTCAQSSSTRPAETRETDHIFQACFVSRLSAFSQQSLGYHRFW